MTQPVAVSGWRLEHLTSPRGEHRSRLGFMNLVRWLNLICVGLAAIAGGAALLAQTGSRGSQTISLSDFSEVTDEGDYIRVARSDRRATAWIRKQSIASVDCREGDGMHFVNVGGPQNVSSQFRFANYDAAERFALQIVGAWQKPKDKDP